MASPTQKESLNKLVDLATTAAKRRKAQAKTPSMTGVNQTVAEIKSFEEAMNVALTAILGGPQAVGKNFASLQSIAKDKNNVFGIVNSTRDIVKNIGTVLSDVAQQTKIITDNISNNFNSEMETLTNISESLTESKELLENISKSENNLDTFLTSVLEDNKTIIDSILGDSGLKVQTKYLNDIKEFVLNNEGQLNDLSNKLDVLGNIETLFDKSIGSNEKLVNLLNKKIEIDNQNFSDVSEHVLDILNKINKTNNKEEATQAINIPVTNTQNIENLINKTLQDNKTIIDSISGDFGLKAQLQYLNDIKESILYNKDNLFDLLNNEFSVNKNIEVILDSLHKDSQIMSNSMFNTLVNISEALSNVLEKLGQTKKQTNETQVVQVSSGNMDATNALLSDALQSTQTMIDLVSGKFDTETNVLMGIADAVSKVLEKLGKTKEQTNETQVVQVSSGNMDATNALLSNALQSTQTMIDLVSGKFDTETNVLIDIADTVSKVLEKLGQTKEQTVEDNLRIIFDPVLSNFVDFTNTVDEIEDIIKSISKNKTDSKNKGQLIQLAAGDPNIGTLLKSMQDFDEKSLGIIEKIVTELNKLNSIDLSKFRESTQTMDNDIIQNLAEKFDSIKDLYENHITVAAEAATKGDVSLDNILKSLQDFDEKSLGKVDNIVNELNKLNNIDLTKFKENIQILDNNAIKSLIDRFDEIKDLYEKHIAPAAEAAAKGQRDLEAIKEANKKTNDVIVDGDLPEDDELKAAKESFENIADVIITGATVMIFGALVMKMMPDLPKLSVQFGITLALFLGAVLVPISYSSIMVNKYGDASENFKAIGDIVATAGLVMMIGALFMKKRNRFILAMEFTGALTVFLLATISAVTIATSFMKTTNYDEILQHIHNLSGLVATAGAVLVLGALFMKIPDLFKDAMLFSAALSVFVLAIMLPIGLISKFGGDKVLQRNVEGMGKLILSAAAIMTIGALFVMFGGGKFVKNSLLFGAVFGLFLMAVLLPLRLLRPLLSASEKTLSEVTRFVTVCATIMLLGALFVMVGNGKFVEAAFKFGLVLNVFLLLTIAPFLFLGLILPLIKSTISTVANFIVKCAAVMTVGALFMIVAGGKFALAAIGFGLVLNIFINLVIAPFMKMGKNFVLSFATIHTMQGFIQKCTTMLLIGALFMMWKGGAGVKYVLLFAGLLVGFIYAIISPFVVFKKKLAEAYPSLKGVTQFILISASLLMLGALFMMDKERVNGAWKFAGMLVLFVTGLILPFVLFRGKISQALKTMREIEIFVAVAASVMILGTIIINKYGWENAAAFVGLLAGFVFAMSLIFAFIGSKNVKRNVKSGTEVAAEMALGIALLGVAVGVAMLVTRGIDWKQMLVLVGTVFVFGLIFDFLGSKKIKTNVKSGIEVAKQMALGIALLGVAVGIASYITKGIDWKQMLILVGTVVVFGAIFYFLGTDTLAENVKTGTKVAMQMALGIALLGVAVGIANYVAKDVDWKQMLILVGTVVVFGAIFYFLGTDTLKKKVALGALVAMEMAVAIGLLSVAIGIANLATKGFSIEQALMLVSITAVFVGIFALIGVPAVASFVALGALVAMEMAVGIGLLSVAIGIANTATKGFTLEQAGVLVGIVAAFAAVFGIIGIPPVAAVVALGGIVALEMSVAMAALGGAIIVMSQAADAASKVKNFKALHEVVKAFFDMFIGKDAVVPGPIKLGKVLTKSTALTAAMLPASYLIRSMANTIKDISDLKVPEAWDKDGNPTKYKTLTSKDFETSAENVGKIVNTLGSAIIDVYDKNPKIFNKPLLRDTPFKRVVDSSSALGKMISMLSTSVADTANLKVANTWDNKGNVTKYRTLSNKDFELASKNIGLIVKTLGTSIIRIYDKNPEMFDKPLFRDTPFKRVVDSSTSLSMMISKISRAIANYSSMKIPEGWDKEGNPIKFRTLTTKDFENAASNIQLVISTMASSINDLLIKPEYKDAIEIMFDGREGFMGIGKRESGFSKLITGIKGMINIIGSVTRVVYSYASKQIPIEWNNEGTPTKFTTIDYAAVSKNIIEVLTSVVGAVQKICVDPYYEPMRALMLDASDGFLGIGKKSSTFSKIISSTKNMGEMLSSIISAIKGYANLMFPTKWNKDGQPIAFEKFTDFEGAAKNIATIISAMFNGIDLIMTDSNYAKVYEAMLDGDDGFLGIGGTDSKFIKVVSSTKALSEAISSVATTVQLVGSMMIPDKWNSDGKPVHYTKMTKKDIEDAKENIALLTVSLADALLTAYDNPSNISSLALFSGEKKPLEYLSTRKGQQKLDNIMNVTAHISEVVGNVSKLVTNISELKVPTGFDKDGNATGYIKINANNIDEMMSNLGLLLLSIPATILSCVSGDNEKLFGNSIISAEQSVVGTLTSAGNIIDSVLQVIEKVLTEERMNLLQGTIENILSYKQKYNVSLSDEYASLPGLFVDLMTLTENFVLMSSYLNNKINDNGNASSLIDIDYLLDIGEIIDKLVVESNAITNSVNLITNETLGKERIATILSNVKDIQLMLYNTFNGNLNEGSADGKSWFSSMFGSDMIKASDINTNEIYNKIAWLDSVINMFTKTSEVAQQIQGNEFSGINLLFTNISTQAKQLDADAINKYLNEAEATEKFVKAIDKVQVQKVAALTQLLEQINKLSEHIGGLDEFTKVLSEKLSSTLNELTTQIRDAQRTIKDADRIQKQRHELIDRSISKVQDMMNKTLQVNVTTTTSGSETTTDVTEEER